MNRELTKEQIQSLEYMVERRMENTNETRDEASAHVVNFLRTRLLND